MSQDSVEGSGGNGEVQRLDPSQAQYLSDQLKSEQNLGFGIMAGAAAALAGAGLWAAITVTTGYQIGFMAIGIGILVGFGVRKFGRGIETPFAVTGGVLALLGCAVGNLLAACGLLAKQEEIPFLSVLGALDPAFAIELMKALFSPMDLLFYGIAVWEGYKLSLRRVTEVELKQMLTGSGGAAGG
jgi:hypothetical protein